GEIVYARIEDEPFIVSVSKSILDSVPGDSIHWQDLAIYKLKPEDIATIEVTKPGQPPVSVTRAGKAGWKLNGAGTLNDTNVQSLANTLASLRAVRWIGPDGA